MLLGFLAPPTAHAQESVCARVKIEIKQELTLERQAFDAEMRITNSLPATPLTEILVDVRVTDELGAPVTITTDPNNLNAKFFLRQTQRQGISDTTGTGEVAANSTATINWMLIPAPGAAGNSPFGKRYLVGATLRYRFGSETHVMELNPDAITVKPLPLLTLDYFLTRDIIADDPFTAEVEAPEPYTLGVRVRNTGIGPAQQLKINSAQPRILDNRQGLPITFVITGSYVQDLPASNSLLIPFGDIGPGASKMGRWVMESNLAGTFVDFTASFTHSDELGGALTSLLQATNAHLLLHDVRVDLPGRDMVRDFLAHEGTALKLYESEGAVDSDVTDRSAEATLTAAGDGYRLQMPASSGYVYVRKPDPYQGAKVLGAVRRSDAKAMATENVWLSKSKNAETQQWEHWVNIFDANSPGTYDVAFGDPSGIPGPPVMQFIPDRVVKENQAVGFLVEASSPAHKPLALSAEPLPTGAHFLDQHDGTAVFDWTPGTGTAGDYVIHYVASDGSQQATRSAKIRVESVVAPQDPATPQLKGPLSGSESPSLRPLFRVLTSEASNDPTQSVEFQLYKDSSLSELVDQKTVPENPVAGQDTEWLAAVDLNDNTHYWWRARANAAGDTHSAWVDATFFTNTANDVPDPFNPTSPDSGMQVDTLLPTLAFTNATDRDEDAIKYTIEVFAGTASGPLHERVTDLLPDASGTTSWTLTLPLANHATYYWRVVAIDEEGGQTATMPRSFHVDTGNAAPTAPTLVRPVGGSDVGTHAVATLVAQGATDADHDALTYEFEIDTVDTFDSPSRQNSGAIPAGAGEVAWQATGLLDNQRYHWRVKASDGRAESDWAGGDFMMDEANEPPSKPVVANPGDGTWVSSQYPSFSVHPALDPEGDALVYQFEVYRDAALQSREAYGDVAGLIWTPSSPLLDKVNHYWRVRARDPDGALGEWSATTRFVVSTSAYEMPTIVVTSPATIVDARDGNPRIAWNGTDPNIEPNIALYYDHAGSGYAGTRIVDNLHQDAGTQAGSYVWNMAGLAPGAYWVYGQIFDDKGEGQGYAPGTVVVPANPQLGVVQAVATTSLSLREGRDSGQVRVSLARAPIADVVVPLGSSDTSEASVAPNQFVFTPANWSTPQFATVIAVADGVKDGDQPFTIVPGKAVSRDPHYISVTAAPVAGTVLDQNVDANAGVSISSYQLVSRKLDRKTGQWEYQYNAVLTNNGPAVRSVTADIASAPGFTVVQGRLRYGAVDQNGTVVSDKQIVLRRADDIGTAQPVIYWTFKVQ
jgi:hypothetical protein